MKRGKVPDTFSLIYTLDQITGDWLPGGDEARKGS
jgi:hypothetical protein